HPLVDVAGGDVLLEEQLGPVRQRLQDAEGTQAVGALAHLHLGDEAALAPDEQRRRDQPQREGGDHLQHDDEDVDAVHHAAPAVSSRTRSGSSRGAARSRRAPTVIGVVVPGSVVVELPGITTQPGTTADVTFTGSSRLPPAATTVTCAPAATPRRAASSGWTQTVAGRAVRCSALAPSSIVPCPMR